jgi:L-ribulose-5-phosphate 3-epimerase
MSQLNRRDFLHFAQAACVAGAIEASAPRGFAKPASSAPAIRLGVTMRVAKGQDPKEAVGRVHELGFTTCQIGFMEQVPQETVTRLKDALAAFHIEATAMLAALPGPAIYNFYDGPLTIGLIPEATRRARIDTLKATADMASECGIPAVHTHCGFIPENPNDPVYKQAVAAVHEVAQYCQSKGRMFYCETGQETPVTLLRLIDDVNMPNVFVNLDVANFILYDKANPVDALAVLGPLVRGMHAKDGLYPTDPKNLGKEVPIGKGKVDFRRVIERLRDLNYKGAMTIEREIRGAQQSKDILESKNYLEKIIDEVFRA